MSDSYQNWSKEKLLAEIERFKRDEDQIRICC